MTLSSRPAIGLQSVIRIQGVCVNLLYLLNWLNLLVAWVGVLRGWVQEQRVLSTLHGGEEERGGRNGV